MRRWVMLLSMASNAVRAPVASLLRAGLGGGRVDGGLAEFGERRPAKGPVPRRPGQ